MNILYLILARGGSKGLPGKNIKELSGKPLIAYTILAAKNSRYKGKIVVNTDNEEIAACAKEYGAEVPFIRPLELATDESSSIDVIIHSLDFYSQQNIHFDLLVLLQPTSPLRVSEDIDNAIDLLVQKNVLSVVSVCQTEHHPLWSNILPDNMRMKDFIREEVKGKNRQQLPTYYRLNGAVYVSRTEAFLKHKSFFHEDTYAYIMPTERSVDIDNIIDFKLAELLIKK